MPKPGFRTLIGLAACGVYGWRVQDPKGSYAALYDLTDWLTTALSSLFVADSAVTGFLRNALNLILLDQVEGFLIGVVFASLISAVFWPVRAGARWCGRKVRGVFKRKPPAPPPLVLTDVVSPASEGSSHPGRSARS